VGRGSRFVVRRSRNTIQPVGFVHTFLLGALLVLLPLTLAAAVYAFMWAGLWLVRFVPLIGRKHRHADWNRLNK
jgi:hypothetical protein